MKQRFIFLLKLYLLLLLNFILQKPLFMWICSPTNTSITLGDIYDVIRHGLILDLAVTGYLFAIPLLLTMFLAWWKRELPWRKILLPYYIFIALAMSMAFISDASLYPFWQFKLDATVFLYLDNPQGAFASVSTGFILVRALLVIAYCAALIWALVQVTPERLPSLKSYKLSGVVSLIVILSAIPLAITIRGGLTESTANIGKVYYSPMEFLNHSAVNPLFSMLYSLDKADNYADEFNYFDEHKRKALFEGVYQPTPVETDTLRLLTTRRPNILLIIMEGFGGQFTEAIGGRTDIAPNYNRLAHEGVHFTNCYSSSYRTDRGLVSALSGYASFPSLSVMKLPVKSRTLPCLPGSLNAAGYKSSFLYGGDINFTNMQSYLRTGGYSDITSDVDFRIEDRHYNKWGANDSLTSERLFELIMQKEKEEKLLPQEGKNAGEPSPWHMGYLTLSSHEPFVVPYHRLEEQVPNAFAFTDHCLGRLIERLRKTSVWDDLLVILIPDHGFYYPEGISHHNHHHNTMLWLGGAVKEPRVVDTFMTQSDLPATLLGQLGINHDEYTFSRDIFSTAYDSPFAFFTFREGFGLVDSTGYSIYDIVGDKVSENEGEGTDARIERGKAILQSFYDDIGGR